MKHILNNLTNEEKNRIREQHKGGMSLYNSRFKILSESSIGNVKPLISEQTPTGGTPTTVTTNEDDGKSKLIEVLTNHLNVMKNSQEWTAIMVAQGIYNDCAHFMNKTSMFSSRPGDALGQKVPFAPRD